MINPPKWAQRFLKWYCNPQLLEEIEGDIYELFDRRIDEKGPSFARKRFAWDVIRFCRWSNIKRSKTNNQRSNSIIMLTNYLQVGFRNITRNWLTSSINILGLALALGCLITLFIFIDMQQNMDRYHSNAANIYQIVNKVRNDDGNLSTWGDSPIELGPTILANHPQAVDIFRIEQQTANVKYEDKVFQENLNFVDPGYLNNLDYDFLSGDHKTLENRDHVVISYYMAEKYFADEDPIGKQITMKFYNSKVKTFTVGAVLDKYRYNTSIRLDFMIPMANFEEIGMAKKLDWAYLTDATFVVLQDGTDPNEFKSELLQYIEVQNSFDPEWIIEDFELISLNELSQRNFEINSPVAGSSHPSGRIALGVIAILLTLLACFNYMNISVASSTKRLKEIALRKVMGSNRSGIAIQFLFENLLQVIIAILLGCIISYFLFMPGFNSVLPFTIPFKFASIYTMIAFFLGIFLFVGIISSLYPSLYVSKFQPVNIFKGKTRFGSKNLFSKILLGFQLTVAFITVVSGFLFAYNAMHLKNTAWGYNAEDILSVRVNDQSQFSALREFADNHPDVAQMIGASDNFTQDYGAYSIKYLEKDIRSIVLGAAPEYAELMQLKLIEGRFANRDLEDESNMEVIINEQMVSKLNLSDPLGKRISIDSDIYTIVGVVEDFQYHLWIAYEPLLPAMICVNPKEEYHYAIFKSTPGTIDRLDASINEYWSNIAPNDPYDRVIQMDAYDEYLREMDSNIMIIGFISLIAVVLASLGLFGLLSFNIQSRLKEFSVRKILGAELLQIITVASRQYFWIVIIAFFLGAPLGYFLINQMIVSIYPDPAPASATPFIVAILIMVLTLSLSIIGQLLKAGKVNPVENLRHE